MSAEGISGQWMFCLSKIEFFGKGNMLFETLQSVCFFPSIRLLNPTTHSYYPTP